MQRGQRHLARADQVELVVGHAVDLLLGVGQEAGAVQRLLAHQHRRHHRHEALLLEQREHPLHERQLEAHERALEVDEARAGHARARLQVEVLAQQLHVVAARAAGLALLAQHLVAGGALGSGRLGSAPTATARRSSTARSSSSSSFSRAEAPLTSAIASEASSPSRWSAPMRFEASFFSRLSSSSSGRIARRRSSSSSASSSSATSKPRRRERRSRRLRIVADLAQVEHVELLALAGRGGVGRAALRPRVLVEEVGHGIGLVAHHDVRGHDRPGEAAVADRVEGVVAAHLAHVEVRPVRALAALERSGRLGAVGVGGVERVAARAALVEELGALAVDRLVLGDGRSRRRNPPAGRRRGRRERRSGEARRRIVSAPHASPRRPLRHCRVPWRVWR